MLFVLLPAIFRTVLLRDTAHSRCVLATAVARGTPISPLANRLLASAGEMRLGYLMTRYVGDAKRMALLLAASANVTCRLGLFWNLPCLRAVENAQRALAAAIAVASISRGACKDRWGSPVRRWIARFILLGWIRFALFVDIPYRLRVEAARRETRA